MSSLVALEKYQEFLGVTDPGVQLHALMAASQAVRNFCDRDFGTVTVTEAREFFPPDRGTIVDIDDCTAVNSITGVSTTAWRAGSEGPAASSGVFTYVEFALRVQSPLMGFTRNEDVFGSPGYTNSIEVNADWGWPDVPEDVQQATIWAAATFEGDASNRQGGLASKSVAEVSENYVQQQAFQFSPTDGEPLPARSRALLWPYRRTTL